MSERVPATSFEHVRSREPEARREIAPVQRRLAIGTGALAPFAAEPAPSSTIPIQMFADAVSAGIHQRLVQLEGSGGGLTSEAVHRAAAHGLSGSGGALPHLAAIQRSFGRHDVSGVSAHVGGKAAEGSAAMGARAYAAGGQVAFASAPDLHLAAHEAAHVVQQRGGVQLSGGVGAAGDVYERHADAVADHVTRGESAEALLDQHAPSEGAIKGVQRTVQMDLGHGHGRGHRPSAATPIVRCPAEVDRLVEDALAAIAANEVGGATVAPPSAMATSSGESASYGSATQMIASHAIGVLRSDAGAASASEHGIDETELRHAHDVDSATRQIWALLVEEHQPISAISHRLRERTGFTDEELGQMVQFGRVRDRMMAARAGFPARIAAVQAALEARGERAAAALDRFAAQASDVGGVEEEAEEAEEAEEVATEAEDAGGARECVAPEQVVDDAALTAALEARALRGLAPLGGVTLPVRWERMTPARRATWIGGQRRLLEHARGRIEDLADTTASSMLAQELATDPDAIGLGFGVGGLRAYIHDGRFNRFAEDRAAWIRVGLRHAAEDHPEQGSNRSLDGAIASAVEADGGWELSRAEYDGWIRHYMGAHPAATDEQVVRAAAAHNGHSSDYPDRIWANYQRLHRPSVTDCEGPAAPVAPGALVVPPLG